MATLQDQIAELDTDAVDQMKTLLHAMRSSLAEASVQMVKWNAFGDGLTRVDTTFPHVITDPTITHVHDPWFGKRLPTPDDLPGQVRELLQANTALAYQAAGHYRRVTEALDSQLRNLLDPRREPVHRLLVLLAEDRVGYIKPSDEWTEAYGGPLTEEHQQAAHALLLAGLLPAELTAAYGARKWGAGDPEPRDRRVVYTLDGGRQFELDVRGYWQPAGDFADVLTPAERASATVPWEELTERYTLTDVAGSDQ